MMESVDWTQLGIGGVFALLLIDRAFRFVKERGSRNGGLETARTLATIVEKCDQSYRDIREIKRQLERQWTKYDVLTDRMTKCEVRLEDVKS